MKLRSSDSYWLIKNGKMYAYTSLLDDKQCDVLVIGGGITGALMAYQFSSKGFKTMLIDKRPIARGSTAASTAMLQYELDLPLNELIEKVGETAAVRTYQYGVVAINELRELIARLQLDCGFQMKESVYVSKNQEDSKSLREEFDCRHQWGFDVKWLSEKELHNNYGIVSPGGIVSKAGANVDSYRFSHGLIHYTIINHGLTVYDETLISEVKYSKGRNVAMTSEGFRVDCQHVIYATGYETQSFLKEKIVDLNSTYACVSEPVENISEAVSSALFWDTDDPYFYMRTTSDNRFIIGGKDEEFVSPENRDELILAKEELLVKRFNEFLPGMEFSTETVWAGTFGTTKDAMPYIGAHPDYPSSYFVLGFGGNGITFSVMGMNMIADAVSGRHNPFLEYFRFNR